MTLAVFKVDKSNSVKEAQLLNIDCIDSTCVVTKCDKSIDIKEEQPANILVISVTKELSKSDKSISIKFSMLANMPLRLVNFILHSNLTVFIELSGGINKVLQSVLSTVILFPLKYKK